MTTSLKTTEAIGLQDSSLVQMLLGKGQFQILKSSVVRLLVWLPWQQKAPIDL